VASLVLAAPAYAATLYVSPSGSDTSPGTLAAPVATPARALQLAAAGDTILLRAGTYSITRTIDITKAGIVFKAAPGESVRIVAGTSDLTNLTSVVVVYSSGVTVENLELQGASYYGVKITDERGPQSGIVLRNLHIHHTGRDAIKAQGADGVIIEDCQVGFTGARDASNAEGIDIMGSIGATVRRNYVHDIPTTGIFVKAGTRQAVVEGNRVERTGHAGILLGSESAAEFMRNGATYEATDAVARNNIVVDARLAGLGSIAGDNIRFENNTVINAASGGQSAFRAAANEYGTATRNILLKNNIFVLAPTSTRPMVHLSNYAGGITSNANIWFSAAGKYQFWRDTTTGGTNSYWTSLAQWSAGMNADHDSRTVDPLLDASSLYRPLAVSPVADAGEALASVRTDYAGIARPQGSSHDIGAYELAATAAPSAPTGVRIVR
jgi:hypothetical protein